MNRLASQHQPSPQPRLSSNNKTQMTFQEYMTHKNIPIPVPAKKTNPDRESNIHILQTCSQNKSGPQFMEQEDRTVMIAQEMERLMTVIEEKNREIESLRQTENSSKVFSSQFHELNQSHQQELQSLHQQTQNYKMRNQDLKGQVEQYMNDINRVNLKYQELCKERDEFLQSRSIQDREMEQLIQRLNQREEDVESLEERLKIMESKHQMELAQLNQSSDFQKRSMIDSQIKELSMKFNQERTQFEIQIRNANHIKQEQENKCALLAQENERLMYLNGELNSTQESLKQRIFLFEQERTKHQKECFELQQYASRAEEDLECLNQAYGESKEQHTRDRMKIVIYGAEIERLWCIIQDTDQTNKKRFMELEDRLRQVNNGELEILRVQVNQEIERNNKLQKELHLKETNLEQKSIDYQNQIGMLTTEIERLNNLLGDYEYQIKNDGIDLDQAQLEIKSQENHINSLEIKLNQINQFHNEQMNDLKIGLEQEIQEKDDKLCLLSQECERLRRQLEERQRELDLLKNIQNQQQSEFQMSVSQCGSQKQRLQELNLQVTQLNNELIKINQSYQNCLIERDSSQIDYKNSQRECELLRLQINENEANLKNMNEQMVYLENRQQMELQDLKKQYEIQRRSLLDQQIRELTMKYNSDKDNLEMQIRNLQHFKLQLENKCYFLQQELDKSQYNQNELSQDKEQLEIQLDRIRNSEQNEIMNDRMRIIILCSEIERLQFQLEQNQMKNTDQVKQLTNQLQQQLHLISSLEDDRSQLRKDQEQKVFQMSTEIDDLYSQIEQYQNDVTLYQKNNLELSDLETRFQAERMSWETQKYQYQQQLQDKDQKIQMLNQEIQRWSNTAEDRMREIENWKNRCSDNQFQMDYEKLKQQLDEQEQIICDLEHSNLKMKSSVQQLEKQNQLLDSQLQDKQREIEDTYALMSKQRRQSEYSNKEAEAQRKSQLQLNQTIQHLESQLMQQKEIVQYLQNQNQDLIQQKDLIEQTLQERDSIVQKKTLELNEKIRELDLMKEKYQQRNAQQIQSYQQTSMITRTSHSITRKMEQQENIVDKKNKNSISVPPQNQNQKEIIQRDFRQVMSVINNNQIE